MKERLLTFTEGSSATLGMLIWWNLGGWCSFLISLLSLPFLVSPSYYSASKKTCSNKHANIFTYFTQKWRLGRWKMPHSREEGWQPPSPLFIPTFPSIYHRTRDKKCRKDSWWEESRDYKPRRLEEENAVGDIQDRKGTLPSLLFHRFLLPFGMAGFGAGCVFCLGGVFGSEEPRGARVGPREREPKTGCFRPDSGLSS